MLYLNTIIWERFPLLRRYLYNGLILAVPGCRLKFVKCVSAGIQDFSVLRVNSPPVIFHTPTDNCIAIFYKNHDACHEVCTDHHRILINDSLTCSDYMDLHQFFLQPPITLFECQAILCCYHIFLVVVCLLYCVTMYDIDLDSCYALSLQGGPAMVANV
uniref:Uncharacterized protein n=1 Tax=Glossina pallidipes TaxID=7398 RepID=A0A1A9Z8P5_GLOPL